MNLPNQANLPNFAKMFTFYTKYFKLSSKCPQYRFKAFQNEIKYLILNFDIFKIFLIFTEFGKLSKFAKLPNLAGKLGKIAKFAKIANSA